MSGKLYLIPTPVGNLEDMTLRAIRLLKECDLLLAEDTRQAAKLLQHFGIEQRPVSYHQHNEHKITPDIVQKISSGLQVAMITDAGTPGISDPAYLLVKHCADAGLSVECLPGPTAFVPALVVSALPTDTFVFIGFLPHKKGRQKTLTSLADEERTMIFYESPFRVVKALTEMGNVFGSDRQASISREISKKFEETVRGTLSELQAHFEAHEPRGEFVIIVAGKK